MQNHFIGIIENRADPLKLGRCKVRVFGIHTHDKSILPTDDLPWALQLTPNSAAMNGIGDSPTNYVNGTTVLVIFTDEAKQVPVIMGSLVGIPQTNSKLIDSNQDSEITFDDEGTTTGHADSVAENPEELNPNVVQIPTEGSGNQGVLEQAIVSAGITSKYARASILGICLVECNFKLVAENLKYSNDRLLKVFPSIFNSNPALAEAVAGLPENTAEVIYGPITGKGKELGNDVIGDAYRYRGRGFVQLTGKANYKKYSYAGVDLVNNPDLLLDPSISAKVAVQYFLDRVKTSQDDVNYINFAIKAVGHNSPDIREKKFNAYYKFLGNLPTVAQTDKSTSNTAPKDYDPANSINGIPKDRISGLNYGFSDPDLKYPLVEYLNEPDTNRLARGRFKNTIVDNKDLSAIKNVPVADGSSWNQPISAYNAQYPYNKVNESESGHIQEIDDTPGNERIHTYHRKGTFEEVDCNGSKVTRIVGDSYEILDRNGHIYITGNSDLTVSGNINILGQSNCNIKIYGNTNLSVHGDLTTNVGGNYLLNVAGSYKVKATSILSESNSLDINSSQVKVTSSLYNFRASTYNETITGKSSYRWEGDTARYIGGDTYNRHESGSDFSCPADPARDSDVDCSGVDSATSATVTGLGSPIGKLNTVNPKLSVLTIPIRSAETVLNYESPEELNGSQPVIEDAMPETQKAPVEVIKNKAIKEVPASCEAYQHMTEFPSSMVIHTDSTGYNWTLGQLTQNRTITPLTVRGVAYSKSDIICNLKCLAENVLGPLNERLGQIGKAWLITSCYRNNIPSGGSATSQHLSGQAVDISIGGNFAYSSHYDWAKQFAEVLNFDQLLLEYRDKPEGRINWIHIGYKNNGNRKQVLTFLNDRTNTTGLKKLA